jgi:hypothetical protein
MIVSIRERKVFCSRREEAALLREDNYYFKSLGCTNLQVPTSAVSVGLLVDGSYF